MDIERVFDARCSVVGLGWDTRVVCLRVGSRFVVAEGSGSELPYEGSRSRRRLCHGSRSERPYIVTVDHSTEQ